MEDISEEYRFAYKEVLEVLKHMEPEYQQRVPLKMMEFWRKYASEGHNFIYDEEKPFKEQNISKRAKVILAIVYRDCYATQEERENILRGLAEDRVRVEEEKRATYNPDTLFDNAEEKTVEDVHEEEKIEQSVITQNEGLFTRILRKIKGIFSKN